MSHTGKALPVAGVGAFDQVCQRLCTRGKLGFSDRKYSAQAGVKLAFPGDEAGVFADDVFRAPAR